MIEQLLEYDTQLFLFLNNLGSESWDGLWRFITEKYSSIPLYLLLLYLVYKKFGWRGTFWLILCSAILIAASDQLANAFKYGIKRPRPCRVEELEPLMRYIADRCGRFGYYSAHASTSMAAAVFLGLVLRDRYKYLPFLLLLWAVIVAYSRIYLGVHYPLDSITGMAFGSLIGWGVYRLHQWGRSKLPA